MTHRVPVAWLYLIGMLFCMPVRAQAAPESYDSTIAEAVDEFNAGHFAEAYALFQQAHALEPSARTLRGLGLCAYELGHYVRAATLLERALSDPNKPLQTDQRGVVEEALRKVRRFIAQVNFETQPPDARLELDGVELMRRQVAIDAGDHVLVVSAPGFHAVSSRLLVVGGTSVTVTRVLSPMDVAAAPGPRQPATPAIAPPERATDSEGGLLTRWWFWTLVGVAITGGVVAGVALTSQPQVESGTSGAVLQAH